MTNQSKIESRKSTRAFTLIELMVVILILAILAALIIPRVVGRTEDAKRSKAVTDINTLESALDQFRVDCDRYPTTEEGLEALRSAQDIRGWHGPYIKRDIPADPWGGEYQYESEGRSYQLMSLGADGVEGGEGNGEDIVRSDEG